MENICFIISCKYYRNYESYIEHYIENIQKFYKNSFTIIVDNNSKYVDDIKMKIEKYKNVILLDNDTECKFEIGAYKVGIRYLIDNDLVGKYDFYVFSQDTYVIKNKYDFSNLIEKNVTAAAFHAVKYINSVTMKGQFPLFMDPLSKNIIDRLDFNPENREKDILTIFRLCSCNSFVLHYSKIIDFLEIVKDVVITTRYESTCCERFLSPVLYRLNNNIISEIDISCSYDIWTVNIYDDHPDFFVKRYHQKTENTKDI